MAGRWSRFAPRQPGVFAAVCAALGIAGTLASGWLPAFWDVRPSERTRFKTGAMLGRYVYVQENRTLWESAITWRFGTEVKNLREVGDPALDTRYAEVQNRHGKLMMVDRSLLSVRPSIWDDEGRDRGIGLAIMEFRYGWPMRALSHGTIERQNGSTDSVYSRGSSGEVREGVGDPAGAVIAKRPEAPVKSGRRLPRVILPLGMAVDIVGQALGWALLFLCIGYVRGVLRARRGSCPECGYDLAGTLGAGCTECGWNRPQVPSAIKDAYPPPEHHDHHPAHGDDRV